MNITQELYETRKEKLDFITRKGRTEKGQLITSSYGIGICLTPKIMILKNIAFSFLTFIKTKLAHCATHFPLTLHIKDLALTSPNFKVFANRVLLDVCTILLLTGS